MADRRLTVALAGSAVASVEAPTLAESLTPNRPWRWVIHTDRLDLYADRNRQLTTIDPDGRLLLISCGGALHQAGTALAADGLAPQVTLLPDADPDHMAQLTAADPLPGAQPNTIAAAAQPPSQCPVGEAFAALADVVAGQGVRLHRLSTRAAADLVAAAGSPPPGADATTWTTHNQSTVYAVLFGHDASRRGWLQAGQALSAASVEASRHGVTLAASLAAVAPPQCQRMLTSMLGQTAVAYLALRLCGPA